MKTCSKCKEQKEESEFYSKYGKEKKYLHSYCKNCYHKFQMKRLKLNKEKAIEYKGGVCVDCKGSFRPEVYQFHHLNPEKKDFAWGKARLQSWKRIVEEIDNCVLLCANCHILRHSKDISEYD